MSAIHMTKHVQAPVETVFHHFSNIPDAAETVSGITKIQMLTDGPVGKGTRFRESRIMFRKESTEEMEFTAFEPNKMYTVSADSCGCRFDTTFTFTPDAGGTRVDMDLQMKSMTFFAKLMSPLGKLMTGPLKKCMAQDFDDIAAVAEGRGPEGGLAQAGA